MPAELRARIETALRECSQPDLAAGARTLLQALGYRSDRTVELEPNRADGFVELLRDIGQEAAFNSTRARAQDWRSVELLFQLSDAELRNEAQLGLGLEGWDAGLYKSFLFVAIDLAEDGYSRTDLAEITRAVNRPFNMPVPILFRHGGRLTLTIILRRQSKRDADKDVLEKVTLIKDIALDQPHAGHVRILEDLALENLAGRFGVANFDGLLAAWAKTLDTSELNKTFYRELANWYYWAQTQVTFPKGGGEDAQQRNATALIRLATRLIFVWFLKEKGLANETLFHEERLAGILTDLSEGASSYYKAILQNLFFATLNTEMDDPHAPRRFRGKNDAGRDAHRLVPNVYRYADLFRDPDAALRLFAAIPFLNGGLFECLDRGLDERELAEDPALKARATLEGKTSWTLRVDGFSERPENPLAVPNRLFFCDECEVDLNEVFGTTNRRYKVRGLVNLFGRYKFTVEENTPVEEEVALDPELLGKVFENLLAAYNPETGVTARKQTGSFYTPREIVDYMVDESLIVYLAGKLGAATALAELVDQASLEDRLRDLLAYTLEPPRFSETEVAGLIAAIDSLKVLDPACGSGAFPMGVLHKLVALLRKLDPDNAGWRELQRRKAVAETDEAYRIGERSERQQRLLDIEEAFERNSSDYGRKLYLIENCIYGVDIQPIAVQIAKLRFFISLVVEQTLDDRRPNRGIRPLPNLETKFVAANTLIGIARPQPPDAQEAAAPPAEVAKLYAELLDTFRQYLKVSQPANKAKWLAQGREICADLNRRLAGSPNFQPLEADWLFPTARSADELAAKLPGAGRAAQAATLAMRNPEIEDNERALADIRRRHFAARTPATKEKCRADDKRLRGELADLLRRDGWGSDTAAQLAAWDPYDHNAHAGFFDPEWMFGVREGFDVTIGNPPYVRADSGEAHLALRRAIEASGQYETLWEKWDLYIPFIEKSYKLLKHGGFTSLIVSDAYCHSKYAQKSQTWFLQHSRVRRLDFLSKLQIFDAAVRNITYLFEKADGQDNRPERRLHDPAFGAVTLLPTDEQRKLTYRAFFPEEGGEQTFSAATVPLEEICYISVGMVVHADEKIAQGAFELSDLVSETQDTLHPKPFVEGKHLARWLPATHRWLEWGTPRAPGLFRRPTFPELYDRDSKIMLVKVGEIRAALDENGLLCNEGVFLSIPWQKLQGVRNKSLKKSARYLDESPRPDLPCREDLEGKSKRFAIKYLLGILNSEPARAFLRANRRNNIQLYPEDWKRVPIPDVPADQQAPVVALVDKILAARRADPAADVSALEREIDQLVYRLYGLTAEEIAIVEG